MYISFCVVIQLEGVIQYTENGCFESLWKDTLLLSWPNEFIENLKRVLVPLYVRDSKRLQGLILG